MSEFYKILLCSLLFLGHVLTSDVSLKIAVVKVCNRPIIVFHSLDFNCSEFLVFTNISVF